MARFPHKFAAAFAVFSLVGGANAASVSLIPTSSTMNLSNGDVVTFDIVMDFSNEPTIGGSFDIVFDSSALQFESFFRDPNVGVPAFGRDPDVLDGLLQSWSVASFLDLPSVATLGTVAFSVLPTMDTTTVIALQDFTGPIGGPWQDAFDTIYIVDYNSVELSRVPLPAAVWLMVCGMAALVGLARRWRPLTVRSIS